jgi:hypothetical protein
MSLSKILNISLLICFLGGTVLAQSKLEDDPSKIIPKKLHDSEDSPLDTAPLNITPHHLQPLELSNGARFARAFQYQLSLAEQFGTISGANGSFLPAPEHYLVQHSLTFQFSELFLTSSDFAKILKTYYDGSIAPGVPPVPSNSRLVSLDSLCPKSSPLQCIADSGGWWKRALAGVTATFSLSERQRVVGGIVVPEGPFPADYDKTGQVTFDPARLFINGSNWSGALSALAGMRVKVREPLKHPLFNKHEKKAYLNNSRRGDLYSECFTYSGTDSVTQVTGKAASKTDPLFGSTQKSQVPDCISAFGGSKGGRLGFLAAAIPKFTFKRASQFDFVKDAGILIPAPFGERGVNSYTFNWDLTRLIAPSSTRLAVMDAMTQPSKVAAAEAKDKSQGSKLCVTISHGQASYLAVSSSFTETACREFASNLDSAGQYRIGCVLNNGVSLSPPVEVKARSAPPPVNSCNWAVVSFSEIATGSGR